MLATRRATPPRQVSHGPLGSVRDGDGPNIARTMSHAQRIDMGYPAGAPTEEASAPKLNWPDDYWRSSPVPPSPAAWDESVRQFRQDRKALGQLAADLKATSPPGFLMAMSRLTFESWSWRPITRRITLGSWS